ncbi:MAG: PEGA domain-containing protein [Candidatus Parcubacteria bacterium]|nr:PEGA domain-containing protein [Candidatus Parcubacteria bacterium]
MKRVLLFIAPLLIATIIFFGLLFFLDRKTGKGALQITSMPKSKVYLDNKLLGSTPLCACDLAQMLPVGDYSIKLIPITGEFQPFEEKITINKATLTVVDRTFSDIGNSDGSIISLSPLSEKKDVEILVISLPEKANVFLDNNPVGITPLLLKQVSESDHDLRLTLDGYKDKSLKIKTAAGFKLTSLIFMGVNSNLSITPVASSAAAPVAIITPKILILNTPTGFLRVRESNSIYSLEIAQVKPGEEYELVSEKEGWFEIKLDSDRVGWISSSYAVKQ